MKKFINSILFITVGIFVLFTVCVTLVIILLSSPEKNEKYIPASLVEEGYTLSPAETDMLEGFVAAEGRGEPFVCKVCIAATVINRVESGNYPNTVSEVIAEMKGTGTDTNFTQKETYAASRAVTAASNGQDPTLGATVFTKDINSVPETVTFAAGNMFFGY